MTSVHRWAVVSSSSAPALLAGGWVVAARLEGPGYDAGKETISVLAVYGAPGYWVMSVAFVGLGVCHLCTAWGLRSAAWPGRLALAGGGIAALLVAVVPTGASGGSSAHGVVVATGFLLLALWPVMAVRVSGNGPWALKPGPSVAATASMVAAAVWFVAESHRGGAAGTAERVVTTMQSLWPFLVVMSCRGRPSAVARRRDV
ncbi:DUF998 domain-containing protein [Streptomyces zhihengii]|uniref:DUF998 domain-containing protein n=1 Tax=Streptomyces zhihengii TaxID=1818004 RepID=UPI0033BDB1B6